MIKTSLILCGGKGTRLKKRVKYSPKVLAEIKGVPFLHYQLKWLEKQGVKKIFLLTKYKSNQIINYININKKKYNSKIEVF
ncbi:NTP transferase domain-containing protein, partial [Alphaproteobacteria bacterium]|nr:NTP transferase domain-containing protein [Alphaproteobacteria bacterium]